MLSCNSAYTKELYGNQSNQKSLLNIYFRYSATTNSCEFFIRGMHCLAQRRQSDLKSGGRGPGSKDLDFLGKFPKNFDFFRQFYQKKSIFRENLRKISIFKVISQKILTFQDTFPKNIDFQAISQKNFDFPGINWLFAAISGQIILFQKSPLSNILAVHGKI